MILYLDTSALMKLYVEEPGTEAVRRAAEEAEALATHTIAYPQIRSAFARLHREERFSDDDLSRVKAFFVEDWPRFVRVQADEPLLRRAGDLAELLALRGYDSVHLAAGEHTKLQGGAAVLFACFDARLSKAAELLGLGVLG
jgi:uncharacterized protein